MCYLGFSTDKKKYGPEGQLILGFCAGVNMDDPEGLFATTEHTLIQHYLVPLPQQRMNEPALRRLLEEAVRVNELIAEERKQKKSAKRKR